MEHKFIQHNILVNHLTMDELFEKFLKGKPTQYCEHCGYRPNVSIMSRDRVVPLLENREKEPRQGILHGIDKVKWTPEEEAQSIHCTLKNSEYGLPSSKTSTGV